MAGSPPSSHPPPFPVEWEFDALLTDGGTVHVRPIHRDDGDALRRLHQRLSPEAIYRRFFSPHPKLSDAEVARFTTVDYFHRFALVAIIDGDIVAVVRYDRPATVPDEAEVAFVVEDTHQGRGIATLLLEHLAAAARVRGVRWFVADTLLDNRAMLGVFRDAGFPIERRFEDGVVRVRFPVDETSTALIAMEGREHRAEIASMRRIFEPASVTVLGASRETNTIGHQVVRHLLDGGFAGSVYTVNAADPASYSSVTEVPEPPDIAVIAVPTPSLHAAVEECGKVGVAGVVVMTPGDDDLVRIARAHGMRVVGPNSMGVINTAPSVALNASVAAVPPPPGPLGFLGQSGPLSYVVLQRALSLGLGFSTFISVGDRADVSGNDVLQYWESDENTRAILLYLESFGNPRKFARIARRIARTKPIIAVKSGRTVQPVEQSKAHSHTSAARSDLAVDALFKQAGVVRVDTLPELLDIALVLSHQPVPRGRHVAVVADAPGPATLTIDACPAAGLIASPIEVIAPPNWNGFAGAVARAFADKDVDAVLVVSSPSLTATRDDLDAAVARGMANGNGSVGSPKPVVAVVLGSTEPCLVNNAVPCFPFPEQAVRALGRIASYGEWRLRDEGDGDALDGIDIRAARTIVDRELADQPEGVWLRGDRALELLSTYGITVAPTVFAADAEAAGRAAADVGFPVAVKAAALLHKSDVGAVALNLRDGAAVRKAVERMEAEHGADLGGVLVQRMADPGVETIVGLGQDPAFGPLLMFGLGGIATDLLGDRAFRILPVTATDARELISSVRSAPLLFGYRGAQPVAVAALIDTVRRVAQLGQDFPEIAELDLNPVLANADGACAVDAKVRVQPAPTGPGPLLRRLR